MTAHVDTLGSRTERLASAYPAAGILFCSQDQGRLATSPPCRTFIALV